MKSAPAIETNSKIGITDATRIDMDDLTSSLSEANRKLDVENKSYINFSLIAAAFGAFSVFSVCGR